MRDWEVKYDEYAAKYPDLSKELQRRMSVSLPNDWSERVSAWHAKLCSDGKERATRQSSQDF